MILFASADRYQALQDLVSVIRKYLQAGKHLHVLDMSGERLSLQDTDDDWTLTYFNHREVSKTIWDNLNPHAIEWWKLLSLDNKDSLELPDLPGIEDLTRIIQLAEVIDQLKNHEVLIVVMPPPMHAIKLLQMSQKGPDLIEKLLEPLLNWWDETRKSLSAVEKLLRIHLPSSQQLRLTEHWKNKFEALQTITTNRKNHNFVAILDHEFKNHDQLQHRLSTFALHGVCPTHLAIQGANPDSMQNIERDYKNAPLTLIQWPPKFTKSCSQSLLKAADNEQTDFKDEATKSIHLFVPGIDKNSLKIKQTAGNIHIIHHGSRRSIDIPESWTRLQCQHARIESDWLILNFLG